MIFIPLAAFLFAYYFVNVAGIPQAIKKGFKMMPHQRLKPFDCVTCLSVWTAITLFMLPIQVTYFIGVTFGAGYLGLKMK
jgi:hypothetical protein